MSREDGINVIQIFNPSKENKGEATGSASVWEIDPRKTFKITGAEHEGQSVFAQNTHGGTAPHEIGHLLGLKHEDSPQVGPKGKKTSDPMNTMTPFIHGRKPGAHPSGKQIEKIIKEHGTRTK